MILVKMLTSIDQTFWSNNHVFRRCLISELCNPLSYLVKVTLWSAVSVI